MASYFQHLLYPSNTICRFVIQIIYGFILIHNNGIGISLMTFLYKRHFFIRLSFKYSDSSSSNTPTELAIILHHFHIINDFLSYIQCKMCVIFLTQSHRCFYDLPLKFSNTYMSNEILEFVGHLTHTCCIFSSDRSTIC
jgi:formyltetrahydrofolate hydrolase